jgi:hypothetical protein
LAVSPRIKLATELILVPRLIMVELTSTPLIRLLGSELNSLGTAKLSLHIYTMFSEG